MDGIHAAIKTMQNIRASTLFFDASPKSLLSKKENMRVEHGRPVENALPQCSNPRKTTERKTEGQGKMKIIDRVRALIKERHEFARAKRQLYGMSDRELADIGIARCDITRLLEKQGKSDVRAA